MFLNKYVCVTSRAYDIMDSQLTFTFWSGGFTNKPMQFTPAACTRSSEKTHQNAWNSQPYFFVQWESNKTVMVSLGSIVANTTLKTWEPAITPPPSAPFMCVWLWDRKKLMSCRVTHDLWNDSFVCVSFLSPQRVLCDWNCLCGLFGCISSRTKSNNKIDSRTIIEKNWAVALVTNH